MSDFRWIALALTVTAGCQVYDRVPWRRCWGWLTAKALALRSWVWPEAYKAPVREADGWSVIGSSTTTVSPETVRRAVQEMAAAEFGGPPPPPPERDTGTPRRRPSRRKKVKP